LKQVLNSCLSPSVKIALEAYPFHERRIDWETKKLLLACPFIHAGTLKRTFETPITA
jgi:hypothetical protein